MNKRARRIAAATTVAGLAVLGSATTASAHSGHCDPGEFCLFYNSSSLGYGSVADFYYNDSDLWNNRFISAHAGQGQVVANNAASYRNNDQYLTVDVFTGRNYTGSRGYIPPMRVGNFSAGYKNNVESFRFR